MIYDIFFTLTISGKSYPIFVCLFLCFLIFVPKLDQFFTNPQTPAPKINKGTNKKTLVFPFVICLT